MNVENQSGSAVAKLIPNNPRRISILGLNIYSFSSKKLFLSYLAKNKNILIALNAEKVTNQNSDIIRIVNNHIGYSDGVGVVKALKRAGLLDTVKIAGAEFWLDIVNEFYKTKSFFFLGSTQNVIELTMQKLKKEFPEINIVGFRNGYLKDSEKEDFIDSIQQLKPDVVFIAQGSPKQELLMEELYDVHPAIYMGLGGSFDVYSGFKKRAPTFFLKNDLEWFYRLIKEPTRYKRQLILIKFFILLKLNKLQK